MMGHTVVSQRRVVDGILNEIEDYKKALRRDEQEILDKLIGDAMKKIGAIGNASSVNVWAFILISMMIEREKRDVADRCL